MVNYIYIVSILDLMDCRVKTVLPDEEDPHIALVSILDLMDCRVKTVVATSVWIEEGRFQSLI